MKRSPTVSNVISCGELETNGELNLIFIASKVQGSRLNLKKFPALIIRKTKPKGTVLLFKSGKFLIVGGDSTPNSQILCRKLVKDLQKLLSRPDITIKTSRVANIVAHGHLGFQVNLSQAAELPNAFKDDKYPGLLIKLSSVKSCIVFKSGKVTFNGATQFQNIQQAFVQLQNILQPFKIIFNGQMEMQQQQFKEQKISKKKQKKKRRGKKKKISQQAMDEEERQCITNQNESNQMQQYRN